MGKSFHSNNLALINYKYSKMIKFHFLIKLVTYFFLDIKLHQFFIYIAVKNTLTKGIHREVEI